MRRLVVDRHLDDAPARRRRRAPAAPAGCRSRARRSARASVLRRSRRVALDRSATPRLSPRRNTRLSAAAQAAAQRRHAHRRAGDEARADQDLAAVARRPQPHHRGTRLAQVGVDERGPTRRGPGAGRGRARRRSRRPARPRRRPSARPAAPPRRRAARRPRRSRRCSRASRARRAGRPAVADLGRDAGRQDDDDREIGRRRGDGSEARWTAAAAAAGPRHGVAAFRFHRASSIGRVDGRPRTACSWRWVRRSACVDCA